MPSELKILFLEDNPVDAEIVRHLLEKEIPNCKFKIVSTKNAYLEALDQFQPEVILADNTLGFNAIEALRLNKLILADISFILVTQAVSEEFVTEIIKMGADDYVLKDRLRRLPAAIKSAVKQKMMEKEKLNATQKLIQSEEKYRTLIERVSESFISLDTNWNFIYANNKAEQLLGRTSVYLMGKNFWAEFPEGKDKSFYNVCVKAMETQENIHLERFLSVFEGWFDFHVYPSVSGVTIYFRDITLSKNAEEELQATHDRLLFHVVNSPLGFIEWDNQLLIKSWSKMTEEIFGWNEEEIIAMQKDGLSMVFIEDLPRITKISEELTTGKVERNSVQHRNYTKDGRVIWCEWFNSVLKDQEGKVITIMSLVRDITEAKKSEASLLDSQQKYKLLFDCNPMPMWMRPFNGPGIIDVNESACKVFGYTKDEFLQMDIHEFINPLNLEHFFIEYQKILPEISNLGVWKYKHKDGHLLDVETIAQDINYNGEYVRLTLAIDVTEKIKAEEKLKKSYQDIRQLVARMENIREEERMTIAREIHDELGQQLAGIKMDLSWLTKKLSAKDELIKKRAESIFQLLDETVKTVRRIATKLRPSVLDDLGLGDAIQWQSLEFKKRSGLEVHCIFETDTIPIPPVIRVGLFRVFQESLTNIARHANATEVTVSLKGQDGLLTLSISDNGKGFDATKTGHNKTLGLLGIKERVIMMGGRCEIISHPGKGTRVVAKVPLQNSQRGEN
jgi:PAS domain S-box-containing protein